MNNDEGLIGLPEEHILNASGFNKINTTNPSGDRGDVEELDNALKKDKSKKKFKEDY